MKLSTIRTEEASETGVPSTVMGDVEVYGLGSRAVADDGVGAKIDLKMRS